MSKKEVYAIGDVHGCAKSLKNLLSLIPENAKLVFLGDLINRGPASLECIKIVKDLGKRATYILGNHELHFLAVAAGVRSPGKKDTLKQIFDSKESKKIINWIRKRPLVYRSNEAFFVHAGLHPSWDLDTAEKEATLISEALKDKDWAKNIEKFFGNEPAWRPDLTGWERIRASVNVLTRTRFLNSSGESDFSSTGAPSSSPQGLIPWFDFPLRKSREKLIVNGHWAACGLTLRPHNITADSGCVWGGYLTAVRIPGVRVFQVDGQK